MDGVKMGESVFETTKKRTLKVDRPLKSTGAGAKAVGQCTRTK